MIYFRSRNDNRVSYLAHLFGAIAGLLVGIGILRNLEVESWEKILWWIAVGLYVIMMAVGIIIHVEFYTQFNDFF